MFSVLRQQEIFLILIFYEKEIKLTEIKRSNIFTEIKQSNILILSKLIKTVNKRATN